MKEIKLGTPKDMLEMFKEYLRKELKAAEQWLGVHYTVFFFIAGIILFSGSLYLISIYKYSFLGMVAPIGGLSFIIGWALLLYKISN